MKQLVRTATPAIPVRYLRGPQHSGRLVTALDSDALVIGPPVADGLLDRLPVRQFSVENAPHEAGQVLVGGEAQARCRACRGDEQGQGSALKS